MEIGPLVTRSVLTVGEGDTLRDAAVLMMERGVGSAVVMSEGKPSGIITDREALQAIAKGTDVGKVTVGDCAKARITTANSSTEVVEAARLMRERNFRHLVVVDDQGALIGVFSMRDLVVGLLQERTTLLQERVGS